MQLTSHKQNSKNYIHTFKICLCYLTYTNLKSSVVKFSFRIRLNNMMYILKFFEGHNIFRKKHKVTLDLHWTVGGIAKKMESFKQTHKINFTNLNCAIYKYMGAVPFNHLNALLLVHLHPHTDGLIFFSNLLLDFSILDSWLSMYIYTLNELTFSVLILQLTFITTFFFKYLWSTLSKDYWA